MTEETLSKDTSLQVDATELTRFKILQALPLMYKRYVNLFYCIPVSERPALLLFLTTLSNFAKENPEVWQVFTDILPKRSSRFLIDKLTSQAGLKRASRAFCNFLSQHQRLTIIPMLLDVLKLENVHVFWCTTAEKASDDLKKRVEKALNQSAPDKKTPLRIIFETQPALLGSGTLLYNNRLIDASLTSALKRLESRIIQHVPQKGSTA